MTSVFCTRIHMKLRKCQARQADWQCARWTYSKFFVNPGSRSHPRVIPSQRLKRSWITSLNRYRGNHHAFKTRAFVWVTMDRVLQDCKWRTCWIKSWHFLFKKQSHTEGCWNLWAFPFFSSLSVDAWIFNRNLMGLETELNCFRWTHAWLACQKGLYLSPEGGYSIISIYIMYICLSFCHEEG